MVLPDDLILWLKDLDKEDCDKVGEELAQLGQISQVIKVKQSFVITPGAFNFFKNEENLEVKIMHLLGSMNPNHSSSVQQVEGYIKKIINQTTIPHAFIKKLFAGYEYINKGQKKHSIMLTAYFLNKGKTYKKISYENILGESVLIEKIRNSWAEIYERQILSEGKLHHENHSDFSIAFLVELKSNANLSGTIQTVGENHEKNHYVIQAHTSAKLVYDKLNKKIVKGYVLNEKNGLLLDAKDILELAEIARKIEKILYHPYTVGWEKIGSDIFVCSINPISAPIDYYKKRNLVLGKPHHPGIKIGRVKFFDPMDHSLSVAEDEVVFLKKLTKNDIERVKRASAIIVEDDIANDTTHYIKHYGIPTLTNVKDASKTYSNGEVITVNATSGHIRKGSMLFAK